MATIREEVDKLKESIRQSADIARRKARISGGCAVCGARIPNDRLNHGSYTCGDECHARFVQEHDYSDKSPLIIQLKKTLRADRAPKKERPTSGTSVARKDGGRCELCTQPVLKGEAYFWEIPKPSDEEWDPLHPFQKMRWHRECSDNAVEILKLLGVWEQISDPDDIDTDEVLHYAALNGGIRHFKEGTWETPSLKIRRREEIE